MKKNSSNRKKYGYGTNYIPHPNTTMNDYNIGLAKAEAESLQNPWLPIVSAVGALGQSVIPSLIGGGGSGTAVAANGNNNINQDVEVEGGEMYETPQGEVGEFKGPSHEQGGIPLEVGEDVEEGTKVYSDRLKVGGKTLAERKEAREKKEQRLEKILKDATNDMATKNSIRRQKSFIEKEEQSDLQLQEQYQMMEAMVGSIKKAFGTGEGGVQKLYGGTPPGGIRDPWFKFYDYDQNGNLLPKPGSVGTAKFPKDISGSADYETNKIKNYHDALGITPDTPGYGTAWGDKSNTAIFQNDVKRIPDDPQIIEKLKRGDTKYKDTKLEDVVNSTWTKRNKHWGLTPEGYKFLGPETLDTSGLVKPDAPFVEPTGVLAGMEKYYENNKTPENAKNSAKDFALPNVGDITKLIGDYVEGTAGAKTAAEQRSTDITHTNVYANAGKESQDYLDKSMSAIEKARAQTIKGATDANITGKKSARGSARGVNTMRAMDWLYDSGLMDTIAGANATAGNQTASVFGQKSQVALNADQMKGQGQYQADMANEAAKDAYYTALGQGRADSGLALQHAGKDLNAMSQNALIEALMKKYGNRLTWNGKEIVAKK